MADRPLFSASTRLPIETEGGTLRFHRPGSRTLMEWDHRFEEIRAALSAFKAANERPYVLLCDVLEWSDVEWLFGQLADHLRGERADIDGTEVELTSAVLQSVWSPDHAYTVWTQLLMASKPKLPPVGEEAKKGSPLGESEGQSPCPSTSEAPTTAAPVTDLRGWRDAAQDLTEAERSKMGT